MVALGYIYLSNEDQLRLVTAHQASKLGRRAFIASGEPPRLSSNPSSTTAAHLFCEVFITIEVRYKSYIDWIRCAI